MGVVKRLAPDVVGIGGFAAIVYGVSLASEQWAWIIGGAVALTLVVVGQIMRPRIADNDTGILTKTKRGDKR